MAEMWLKWPLRWSGRISDLHLTLHEQGDPRICCQGCLWSVILGDLVSRGAASVLCTVLLSKLWCAHLV